MSERNPFRGDPVSLLLVEKRCEVYGRFAATVMDLDEAIEQDDGLRTRHLLQELRRTLRGALAFLTSDVYHELEELETTLGLIPPREGPLPKEVGTSLSERLMLLHVRLARSLKLPHLQDMEEIVGLPARLKNRLEADGRRLEVREQRRRLDEQCWRHEAEARAAIRAGEYVKAAKALRRAIRLDASRAVFHNDLGVVLSLQGNAEEAVAEYRRAVALNERDPDGRTEEWTTSYYNLGVALRKAANQRLQRGDEDGAVKRLSEARAAFAEYVKLGVGGAKAVEARQLVQRLDAQLVDAAPVSEAG